MDVGGYCASGLNIDSTGLQREIGNSKLGMYKYYSLSNGRSSFKHISKEYYLHWTSNNYWMVGVNTLRE